jgi:hypothetical protein
LFLVLTAERNFQKHFPTHKKLQHPVTDVPDWLESGNVCSVSGSTNAERATSLNSELRSRSSQEDDKGKAPKSGNGRGRAAGKGKRGKKSDEGDEKSDEDATERKQNPDASDIPNTGCRLCWRVLEPWNFERKKAPRPGRARKNGGRGRASESVDDGPDTWIRYARVTTTINKEGKPQEFLTPLRNIKAAYFPRATPFPERQHIPLLPPSGPGEPATHKVAIPLKALRPTDTRYTPGLHSASALPPTPGHSLQFPPQGQTPLSAYRPIYPHRGGHPASALQMAPFRSYNHQADSIAEDDTKKVSLTPKTWEQSDLLSTVGQGAANLIQADAPAALRTHNSYYLPSLSRHRDPQPLPSPNRPIIRALGSFCLMCGVERGLYRAQDGLIIETKIGETWWVCRCEELWDETKVDRCMNCCMNKPFSSRAILQDDEDLWELGEPERGLRGSRFGSRYTGL